MLAPAVHSGVPPNLAALGFLAGRQLSLLRDTDASPIGRKVIGLLKSGRIDEAFAACDQAIADNPADALAHALRGNFLLETGRFIEAIAAFDNAITHKLSTAPLHTFRSHCLVLIGNYPRALNGVTHALKLDIKYATAHTVHAEILRLMGRFDAALDAVDLAIRLDRKLAPAHGTRGKILGQMGLLPAALDALNLAIDLAPEDSVSHSWRGNILSQMGLLKESIASHNQAIKLHPSVFAYNARALTYINAHQAVEALADIDSIIAIDPNNAKMRALRERLLYAISIKPVEIETKQVDNPDIMNDASFVEELRGVAARYGLPVENVHKALMAERALAMQETTRHATPQPPRLLWPRDATSEESDNPAAFAWRAYAAEAKAETLHLGLIRQDDKRNGTTLAVDLVSWLRSAKNQARVPEGFDIPTKPEWNTRQLAKVDKAKLVAAARPKTEESRLYDAALYRASHPDAPRV